MSKRFPRAEHISSPSRAARLLERRLYKSDNLLFITGRISNPSLAMRSSSPSTILVTGATGQQGGAVIRALLRAGADVRILALTRSKDSAGTKKLAEHAEVEVVEGTFDDPEAVFDKAGEVDQLFLMSTFFDKGTEGEERQAKVGRRGCFEVQPGATLRGI
jgi:hypothetical protein